MTALVSGLARNRQNVSFGAVTVRPFRTFPMSALFVTKHRRLT